MIDRMDRRRILVGGAALAALVPAAGAVTAQDAPAIDEAKLPALQGGRFALMSSQVALERASDEMVRVFAQLEVDEQEAVAAAFGAGGVEIALREDHAALLEQMQALEGAEFDRAYVDAQIAGHEELRPIHEEYAASGEDPMARGASMVGVPSIDTHLVVLRSIQGQIAG